MKRLVFFVVGFALELCGVGDPPMCRGWSRK